MLRKHRHLRLTFPIDMAKVAECGQFLVIEATQKEMHAAVGSPGLCDYCGWWSDNGYYIAVLNKWYCPECYEKFKADAKYYPQDRQIEERNFKYYSKLLGVL